MNHGELRDSWVAACALDACGYFGVFYLSCLLNNSLLIYFKVELEPLPATA